MTPLIQMDSKFQERISSHLLDVLIRAGLIVALALLCYKIFSPFLTMMVWAVILAVTLYPLHQWLARKVGNKQWLASTILVIVVLAAIVAPTVLLMNSFADSVRGFIANVQNNTLAIPAPWEGTLKLPIVGKKIYEGWSKAHTDLPGFIQTMKPKISQLAQTLLGIIASIGGTLLMFIASFIVAGIVMAYGDSGAQSSQAIFKRLAGQERGEALTKLSMATIRAVALGVIGIAAVQAILVGLAMLIAGVPAAGVLAIIVLVLGILQIPAIVVTIPVIIYIWSSGDYTGGSATLYTIILLVTGMSDNVLKPLMLGRGVDVPMPVILLGALGGMAGAGILGMFVGATLLALGYQLFMGWVYNSPETIDEQTEQPDLKLEIMEKTDFGAAKV